MVVGIDEVGRGAWAGPVTVAALVPPPEHLKGVRDSKELAREEREVVAARVADWAVAIGVGHASYEECDALGMTAALRAAGRRALAQLAALGFEPDRIILDGNYDYLALGSRVTTVVRGDSTSLAVAAASCVVCPCDAGGSRAAETLCASSLAEGTRCGHETAGRQRSLVS